MARPFTIELTEGELVVPHDVLYRLSEREDFDDLVAGQSDRQVIYNLSPC